MERSTRSSQTRRAVTARRDTNWRFTSQYDSHPRFTIAMQMLMISGMATSAMLSWLNRIESLKMVALSERLLAAEQARVALESRVRIAENTTRVASAEPLEEASAAHDAHASMRK